MRGPRGNGLTQGARSSRPSSAACDHHPDFEFAEALRNIHRIAELRLDDTLRRRSRRWATQAWDWPKLLAAHSDPGYAENGQLTVTYLTDAHRACAAQIARWMRECGFDERDDRCRRQRRRRLSTRATPGAKTLLTGSHYDTVRNGGKYDGRLGIFVPMVCVRELHAPAAACRSRFEVVGFAEEEGQRYKATFLGSGALIGQFDARWLDQQDADGIDDARGDARTPACRRRRGDRRSCSATRRATSASSRCTSSRARCSTELDLPLGIVTSINGSVRYVGEVHRHGEPRRHDADGPPPRRRRGRRRARRSIVEKRAATDAESVGTVGMLEVPNGSINVVPGRCQFSLDIRAHQRRAARRAGRRRAGRAEGDLRAPRRALHARGDDARRRRAERARVAAALGARRRRRSALPLYRMPSGAGHDAMKLHEVMPQAMLFVRGINSGISHNPLESSTDDDMQLAVEAFLHLLDELAAGTAAP